MKWREQRERHTTPGIRAIPTIKALTERAYERGATPALLGEYPARHEARIPRAMASTSRLNNTALGVVGHEPFATAGAEAGIGGVALSAEGGVAATG